MNRKWLAALFAATLCLSTVPAMAESTVTTVGGTNYLREGDKFEDAYDTETPRIRIVIKDAYKRSGKTEKVCIKLKGATWSDGNGSSLQFLEKKNIESNRIAVMGKGEDEAQLNIDIPADLTDGDEISFEIPLLIRVREDEVRVQITAGDDTQLINEQTIFLGATTKKKLNWQVGEVPTLVKEGVIAPITFKEVQAFALGDDEIEITLELKNDNLAFGAFDDDEKSVHADDTDYILKTADYITYGGGFSGLDTTFKLKTINKNDKKIVVKLTGKAASEIGTITLENIPIINKTDNFKEEEVQLKISGENLVDSKDNVLVAHIAKKSLEEQAAEEQAAIDEEIAEKEAEAAESEAQKGIQFKVGEKQYSVYGETYDMDAETYIQEPGYIMVPLKYVALALGVYEEDIQYNSGMVYFKYGDRTIELRVNSDVATVNRINIQMEVPVVLKDGRSYAPMGEVARLLGLEKNWDGTEKKATFSVK